MRRHAVIRLLLGLLLLVGGGAWLWAGSGAGSALALLVPATLGLGGAVFTVAAVRELLTLGALAEVALRGWRVVPARAARDGGRPRSA